MRGTGGTGASAAPARRALVLSIAGLAGVNILAYLFLFECLRRRRKGRGAGDGKVTTTLSPHGAADSSLAG